MTRGPESRLQIESDARRLGYVALVLDEDGAEFYLNMLYDYNAGRSPHDVGVANDEDFLREQVALVYGGKCDLCDLDEER